MHRFFVPSDWIQPPLVTLQGEVARQIDLVLRLSPGDVILILDGGPLERSVRLVSVTKAVVTGEIVAEKPSSNEPSINLSLYIGMTQRAKFEWILQKGTELGVSAFIPVITSRSLVRESTGEGRKLERWEGILREAAEQSARGKVPVIRPAIQFIKALGDGKRENSVCLIAWEMESRRDLRTSLSESKDGKPTSVGVLIGPEGGFTADEVQQAIAKGWLSVSLGRRILRMETAALTLTALILYELGELRPPDDVATGS